MKAFKYLIPLLLISSVIAGNSPDILNGYLVEAAENNPGLKSSFNEYLASLEQVPQAGALPDPRVTFGYFIEPVETRVGPQQARISAAQMFPWFGTLDARKDAASEMAKSKYEKFEEAKSRLFYDVKSIYYNLYFTHQAIIITNDNINILNTLRKMALIKLESGLASAVDVLRVEIEIADLENQLANLRDMFFSLKVNFNNLLNVDEQREVVLPEILPVAELETAREVILDSIRSGNHQIMQLEFIEASLTGREKAASRAGKPGFSIGLDYMITGESANAMADAASSGHDAIVFPMVGITIPLYRQKYRAMVKETVYLKEAALNKREDKINVLETAFTRTDNDYRDADRRISLYKGQSDRAEKAIEIMETEYATTGKNFEEILRMERQLLKYRLELEKSYADKNAAVAFIDYLMGK
jgi:cobalt-zinc-cadmium efflux system outer membrane protein